MMQNSFSLNKGAMGKEGEREREKEKSFSYKEAWSNNNYKKQHSKQVMVINMQ